MGPRGRAGPGWPVYPGLFTAARPPVLLPGFAELQTDMTDLTKELNRSQGIPFLEYKHFVTRTFFPKVSPGTHACSSQGWASLQCTSVQCRP